MADDIHGGKRPAEVPAYTPTEAARIIRRPVSTVRSWTRGSRYTTSAGKRFWPPIVPAHPPYLSFQNLVELYVLSSLRRLHTVPLKSVRNAIAYLRETAQTIIRSLTVIFSLIAQTCLLRNGRVPQHQPSRPV